MADVALPLNNGAHKADYRERCVKTIKPITTKVVSSNADYEKQIETHRSIVSIYADPLMMGFLPERSERIVK